MATSNKPTFTASFHRGTPTKETSTVTIREIELIRGTAYVIEGFIYCKASQVGDKFYLKCQRRGDCKARATICPNKVKTSGQHSHPAPDLAVIKFKVALKKCTEDSSNAHLSTRQVYEKVKKEFLDQVSLESEKMELSDRLPALKKESSNIRRYKSLVSGH